MSSDKMTNFRAQISNEPTSLDLRLIIRAFLAELFPHQSHTGLAPLPLYKCFYGLPRDVLLRDEPG